MPLTTTQLVKKYQDARQELLQMIAINKAKGNAIGYQQSLLQQINILIDELDQAAVSWANEEIPSSYLSGVNATNKAINMKPTSIKSLSQMHKQAMNLTMYNAIDNLVEANHFVGRHYDDIIRTAGVNATAMKLSTGQTVKQMQKGLQAQLADEGFGYITYKDGKRIPLDHYAELVSRTTTREATNAAAITHGNQLGYNLVRMSEHFPTCKICATRQGRIYRTVPQPTNDIEAKFPFIEDVIPHFREFWTVHVNCRHNFTVVVWSMLMEVEKKKALKIAEKPFDVLDAKAEKQLKEYYRIQSKKRKLNNDKRQWERYRMVLGDDIPKTLSGFRKMKYAASDKGIDKWERLQKNYRESLNAGRKSSIMSNNDNAKDAPDMLKPYEIDYAKGDKYFINWPKENKDTISPRNLMNELNKSVVGKEALEYIINHELKIDIYYDEPFEKGLRGLKIGSAIEIYAYNTQTVTATAQAVIHEINHFNYSGGHKRAEAICFIQEARHLKNDLTVSDVRHIIKTVNRLYPELPWRR